MYITYIYVINIYICNEYTCKCVHMYICTYIHIYVMNIYVNVYTHMYICLLQGTSERYICNEDNNGTEHFFSIY